MRKVIFAPPMHASGDFCRYEVAIFPALVERLSGYAVRLSTDTGQERQGSFAV